MTTIAAPLASTASEHEYATNKILLAALAGGGAAGVVNLGIYLVAHAAGVPFTAKFDPSAAATALPAQMTFIASVVPALASAGLLALLNVLSRKPTAIFLGISVLFGLASLGGPASLAEADVSTRALLALMHVVAGVRIVGALVTRAKR